MDDLSQQVASLKDLLLSNQNIADECSSKDSVDHSPIFQTAEINTTDPEADQISSKDRNDHFSSSDHVKRSLSLKEDKNGPVQTVQRECIMSLDISEYELHMLEMQARQEESEEQSILAFKVGFSAFLFILLKILSHWFHAIFSTSAFFFSLMKEKSALEDSAELSCGLESDEELDNEMIQVKTCFCFHTHTVDIKGLHTPVRNGRFL